MFALLFLLHCFLLVPAMPGASFGDSAAALCNSTKSVSEQHVCCFELARKSGSEHTFACLLDETWGGLDQSATAGRMAVTKLRSILESSVRVWWRESSTRMAFVAEAGMGESASVAAARFCHLLSMRGSASGVRIANASACAAELASKLRLKRGYAGQVPARFHMARWRLEGALLRHIGPSALFRIEGHTGLFPFKIGLMQQLARAVVEERRAHASPTSHIAPLQVCEIGFNVGHSAVAWLTALPLPTRLLHGHELGEANRQATSAPPVRVLAFELHGPDHGATAVAVRHIHTAYGNDSLTIVHGNSSSTIPQYTAALKLALRYRKPAHANTHPANCSAGESGVDHIGQAAQRVARKCDIVFVDGDHSNAGAFRDIKNARELVRRSGQSGLLGNDGNDGSAYDEDAHVLLMDDVGVLPKATIATAAVGSAGHSEPEQAEELEEGPRLAWQRAQLQGLVEELGRVDELQADLPLPIAARGHAMAYGHYHF